MNVARLIGILRLLPPEATVVRLYDGAARGEIDVVYLARSGKVIVAPFGEPAYDDEDRPTTAPTEAQESYWHTPERPKS